MIAARRTSSRLVFAIGMLLSLFRPGFAADATTAPAGSSTDTPWVSMGADGKLQYREDEHGSRIPDFSMVGYRGGIVPLPGSPRGASVQVVITLTPGEGDQTQVIQDAIDRVGQMQVNRDGFRGAILFKAGRYNIAGQIKLHTSGVVLMGEGPDFASGSTLLATGNTKRVLVVVGGSQPPEKAGDEFVITDSFVPIGATQFHAQHHGQLRVGDSVEIFHPGNDKWISAVGMNRLKNPWKPGGMVDMKFNRTITAVQGDLVSIDAPITNVLDASVSKCVLYKTHWPGSVENVGIMNLGGDSEFTSEIDEEHGWSFITLAACRDVWVSNVAARHFGYACVEISKRAQRATVAGCSFQEGVSQIIGARRYSFVINGQLSLVKDCVSRDSRHDFVNNDFCITGPNVFVDCVAHGSRADTGPHRQWTTGVLYDNVDSPREIDLETKGNSGSIGHGWSGINSVLWNCKSALIKIDDPPTGYNWAFGCIGKQAGKGVHFSPQKPVEPRSLYYSQLRERLETLHLSTEGIVPAKEKR